MGTLYKLGRGLLISNTVRWGYFVDFLFVIGKSSAVHNFISSGLDTYLFNIAFILFTTVEFILFITEYKFILADLIVIVWANKNKF